MNKRQQLSKLPQKSVLLLISFLLLLSCNKDTLNYAKNTLLQNEWYESENHIITYRSIDNGPYTILRDTAYTLASCWKNSKYNFQHGGVVKFMEPCSATLNYLEGKWEIDDDRHLLAHIPMQIDGRNIIFGIDGIVTEIDKKHFVVKSNRVFSFISCSNTAPCITTRDSSTYTTTYRN